MSGRRCVTARRRAGMLVAALIVLSWIHLAIISAVTAGADDHQASRWRIEALQARCAAESAARIAEQLHRNDPSMRLDGVIILPDATRVEAVELSAPGPDEPRAIRLQAKIGDATATLQRRLEAQP